MKEKILSIVNARGDQWAQEKLQRISTLLEGTDLVAADADLSCYRKLYSRVPTGMKRGYRSNVDEAMEYIFSYLEDNSEECQFLFEDLVNQIEGEFIPDMRTIKARLRKQYGDDVLITDSHHQTSVLCFKKTGYKILSDNYWYNERRNDLVEERLRILKYAAGIIVEDIRSHVYDNSV
ncbi:hypothetical protein JTE90_011915 [Oedothorax gibbosus]|uniref:Uncharacterized protein n=1 Tax=Oedothorax gibbosus TaxID=931172 RepID=A0AAV6V0M8_9ARAC|nr:hypothetical protein JTE90_011915 [Oedothorax gibbosus]